MDKYDQIMNFYSKFIEMEEVMRKGWIDCKVPAKRRESVADHTLQLIMLSSLFKRVLDLNINEVKLIEMLLVHDLGEIIIGDITEIEREHDTKNKEEKSAVQLIFEELSSDNGDYYYMLWKEMNDRKTYLAKYAHEIDKIDAVIKAKMYEDRYKVKGLFEQFYNRQKEKKTFEDGLLEEFFEYLNEI